ncbi:ATM interactor [Rhincodon typus]|uniref:ATM interactor n=1 Tax=Rhincodon typus TaxID=259920 RepID=UPI0009A25C62|nr:ATM interactor [Rhincodon typus]
MKIHAEKKHRCDKCSNSYGTEWDLKRHAEDCGRIFQCTCGCPYASRPALLSHIYRTGHEIPPEHRDPPRKKRKSEWSNQNCLNQVAKVKQEIQVFQDPIEMNKKTCIKNSCGDDRIKQPSAPAKQIQKLLLPKPKVALVKLPVMHLTHLPVILSSGTSMDNSVKSIVVAVDDQGSILSTMHILPPSVGTLTPSTEVKGLSFKGCLPISKVTSVMMVEPVSTAVQVNMDSGFVNNQGSPSLGDLGTKNKLNSTNVQTNVSCLAQNTAPESLATCYSTENTVSACAQTDLSISTQVLLPVSVQTQTFEPDLKITTSISAQTDSFGQTCFPLFGVSRKTQTSLVTSAHDKSCTVPALINTSNHEDIFDHSLVSSYSVCTQTQTNFPLDAVGMNQRLSHDDLLQSSKSAVDFHINSTLLQQNPMTDNQTQTINLFNDLENILSESIASHSLENRGLLSDASGESMTGTQTHGAGIDFDIEFLSASNTQTQTEENEFGTLQTESALESLDIETQTDFLFSDHPAQGFNGRGQSSYLGLEMFDTQTQTDFNYLIDGSTHLPLDSILKQSSLSLSAESSGTKTQTHDVIYRNNFSCTPESHVRSNCTETQTTFENLSSLFFTSNETQTVMDDFLLADMAWNTMESHFSSVETQTCDEIFSLFRNTDKNSD